MPLQPAKFMDHSPRYSHRRHEMKLKGRLQSYREKLTVPGGFVRCHMRQCRGLRPKVDYAGDCLPRNCKLEGVLGKAFVAWPDKSANIAKRSNDMGEVEDDSPSQLCLGGFQSRIRPVLVVLLGVFTTILESSYE